MKLEDIPIIGSVDDIDIAEKIADAMRDPHCDMSRSRPYDGQPHTDSGVRGRQLVEGLTMRDVRDCFVRAVCLCAYDQHPALYVEAEKGERAKLNKDTLYEIDFAKLDPGAIAQALTCEIERVMGIYPNLPKT
jgi:hypothetical protein